jgi:hypothetical protein
MPRNLNEHKQWLEKQPKKERRPNQPSQVALQQIEQASLSVQAMTGNADWDRFLSYLQRGVEISERQGKMLEAQLRDPSVIDHNEIIAIKVLLAATDARTLAWRTAINLPAQIIESGDNAAELIVEEESEDEQPV